MSSEWEVRGGFYEGLTCVFLPVSFIFMTTKHATRILLHSGVLRFVLTGGG